MKIGLPLNREAAVGFTKWETVIFSYLVSKARLKSSNRKDWKNRAKETKD